MQQLHEPEPSGRYKATFSTIWGLMGVALLVGAIFYSRHLLNFRGTDRPTIVSAGAYGNFATDATVTVSAYSAGKATRWYFQYPIGTQALAVPNDSTCDWVVNPTALPKPRVTTGAAWPAFGSGIVLIDPQAREVPEAIVCTSLVAPAEISYSGRHIEIHEPRLTMADIGLALSPSHEAAPAAPVDFHPNFDNQESLEFFGGASNSGKATVTTDENVELFYTDAKADGERNIGLVIIGAIIALGAAMILESLRPVVETIAHRRDTTASS